MRPGRRLAWACRIALAGAACGLLSACATAGGEPRRNPIDSGPARDAGARDGGAPGDTGAPDPCATVSCPAPMICSGGRCVDAEADDDEDGYLATDDCDDTDPSVHPDAIETCDGKDNDCNRALDDIAQTRTCMMSSMCGGSMQCVGGVATCVTREPELESCNGEDDDCNGMVDDVSGDCTVGVGACQRTGMHRCGMPDECSVLPGAPAAETCNMTDDDCNGTLDDVPGGCGPPPECTPGATRDTGGCGRCGTSRQTCGPDSRWGAMRCEGEGECMPGDERAGSCGSPCLSQRCSGSCRWDACGLIGGAACDWVSASGVRGGRYRCYNTMGGSGCAPREWQYCLMSCQWSTACEACSGCCP